MVIQQKCKHKTPQNWIEVSNPSELSNLWWKFEKSCMCVTKKNYLMIMCSTWAQNNYICAIYYYIHYIYMIYYNINFLSIYCMYSMVNINNIICLRYNNNDSKIMRLFMYVLYIILFIINTIFHSRLIKMF